MQTLQEENWQDLCTQALDELQNNDLSDAKINTFFTTYLNLSAKKMQKNEIYTRQVEKYPL